MGSVKWEMGSVKWDEGHQLLGSREGPPNFKLQTSYTNRKN